METNTCLQLIPGTDKRNPCLVSTVVRAPRSLEVMALRSLAALFSYWLLFIIPPTALTMLVIDWIIPSRRSRGLVLLAFPVTLLCVHVEAYASPAWRRLWGVKEEDL